MMDLGIAGRTALVLGASGGLGRAIATALAREGVRVAPAGRNAAALNDAAAAVEATGGRCVAVPFDLADRAAFAGKLDLIGATLGPVDILVANTGGPPPTPVAGQPDEMWRAQFETMVLSVISLADLIVPGMRERRWGRVITSTSSGVVSPIPNLGLSNALRLTLVGWSKTLAREVGRDGVTANIVLPGRIATERVAFLDTQRAAREGRSIDAVREESVGSIPVGRYGDPEEYGAAIAFLASRHASYITGSVVRIDGGLIASI